MANTNRPKHIGPDSGVIRIWYRWARLLLKKGRLFLLGYTGLLCQLESDENERTYG